MRLGSCSLRSSVRRLINTGFVVVWFWHFIVGGTIAANCRSNGWNRVFCLWSPGIWSLTMVRYVISNLPVDIFLLHDEDFV